MAKRSLETQLMRAMVRLERYTDRPWYIPLLGFLAASDFFILVIPTDALVVSAAAIRPKRWIWIGLGVALGSALGASLFAVAIFQWGDPIIRFFSPGALESESWQSTAKFLSEWGFWALAALAAGPFPLHPAVFVASTAHVAPTEQFLAYFLGRGAKYVIFSWIATHAPGLIKGLWGTKKDVRAYRKEGVIQEGAPEGVAAGSQSSDVQD